MIRTRFSPSPTGFLHVGGLRTALYSYLVAKQAGGQFLLRIEDTDQERSVAGGTLNILKSLYWAGLVPDEGVKLDTISDPDEPAIVQEGRHEPYIQSERLEIYKQYAAQLLEQGSAYYCFCTQERLEELRGRQQANKQPTMYDGACFKIAPAEAKERVQGGAAHVVRLKMPKEGETAWPDLIRGEVRFKNELIDDQVLLKSDGFPTYHLAVVVDDHLMQITHVIRGEEWVSSTPKHIQLYKYFGWELPQFAHLPLILNPDKSKLSKRQGDVAVEDYRQKGYLPEALVNFIAFLGWNPGGERELFSLDEFIKEFSLEKVSKAGAVFNIEKLNWFNKKYLCQLPLEEVARRGLPWFESAGLKIENLKLKIKNFNSVIALERERVTTLAELPDAVKFIFELPEYPAELLVWKKSTREETQKILTELETVLETINENDWAQANLEEKIKTWIGERGYQTGTVLWPLRVALSGQPNSPGPFEIAAVLGKIETARRLQIAQNKITSFS